MRFRSRGDPGRGCARVGGRMEAAVDRFGLALTALERELDWAALGRLYCWDGGDDFFPPEQVEAIRDAGLVIASELAERLEGLQSSLGRSLYVGAAVAELVPMLCEKHVLGREVVAVNLEGEESTELNRALEATERRTGLELLRIGFGELRSVPGEFDHGWMVSVINDPEAFPALHDELYQRKGELATGRGDLEEERERASELTRRFLGKLAAEALLSTSDEELALIGPLVAAGGGTLRPAETALLTAVVGDPLRFCRLSQAPRVRS